MALTDKEEAAQVAKERTERYLGGLEDELAGYRRAGNTDRIKQVEAEIKANGGKVPSDKPKGRTAPTKETAAADAEDDDPAPEETDDQADGDTAEAKPRGRGRIGS